MDDHLKKDSPINNGEAEKKGIKSNRNLHQNLCCQKPLKKLELLHGTSAWITLAILGLTILITMYGETMLLPAIRDIIRDFDISYSTSSWILTAYLISGAVATPIAGKLSDIYGRKKMVLIILIIYIIGICAGGLSSNISFLLIARVIQGIGISIFPIAFGIIRDEMPKEKLAIGVGVFSSMFAAGSVVGLALGANIIENFGWRATFFSIVFVAIGLWFIIRQLIQDRQSGGAILSLPKGRGVIDEAQNKLRKSNDNTRTGKTASIDIQGTVTLAVTITSFLLVLSYSETTNITGSPLVPIFLSMGSVSLVFFIIIERRSDSPLVNL